MSDCMTFPDDWREFLRDFSFKDTEEIYTNGCELIPVFRVAQLIEHMELLKDQEPVPPIKQYDGNPKNWASCWYVCGNCETPIDYCDKFCRRCGRMVKWK